MPIVRSPSREAFAGLARTAGFWPAFCLLAVLGLQLTLVFHRAINWDEFFHYTQVNRLAAGTLTEPLQTLYTRAFVWTLATPGSGIDHIILIRLFMFGFELATLGAIIGIASRFASRSAAWLCALAYAGGGYVFQHATSFRFDGPAAALLMSAAVLLLRTKLQPLALAGIGLLVGVAGVLTIKAVLYAPVFAGIAWLRWQESGRSRAVLGRLVAIAFVSAASFAVIYWLHSSTLGSGADAEAQRTLTRAGGRMFSLGVPPYWRFHLKGAVIAPALTLLVLAFPWVLAGSPRPAAEKLALAGLYLPLATLLFYHNTAPYYFVYMLAPVVCALGIVMDRAVRRYGVAPITLALGALALAVWMAEKPGPLTRQRQLLAAADTMFPEKVAYFDSSGMLGAFPKVNAFMTPMGVAFYKQGAYLTMVETMAQRPVPLVVDDDPIFTDALTTAHPVPQLLPQDLAALREGYVQLWGPFWIAGRTFAAGAPDSAFALRVPGIYRVQGGAMVLDGRLLGKGDMVALERGIHKGRATTAASSRLVWGRNIRIPQTVPPAPPYFTDF